MRMAIFFFLLLLSSCSITPPQTVDENDPCTEIGYNVLRSNFPDYPTWKQNYMEYVSTCLEDTTIARLLAQRDAELGDYTFIIYGTVLNAEPYRVIFQKYPIGFHSPGSEATPAGEVYNRELKKLLLKNEGLNYDTIMDEVFDDTIIE